MDHVRTSSILFEILELITGENIFDRVSDVDVSRCAVFCGV
jgi:hypothetical protein